MKSLMSAAWIYLRSAVALPILFIGLLLMHIAMLIGGETVRHGFENAIDNMLDEED